MGRKFNDLTDKHLQIKIQDLDGEIHTKISMIREPPSDLADKYIEELKSLIQTLEVDSFEEN